MMNPPARSNGERSTRFDPSAGAYLRVTKWQRAKLLFLFGCGLLDYFFYEDEEVVLKGFRDPVKHTTYLTYIGEKR